MRRSDVVVVGGGLIGCAVARELARAGFSTILFERGRIGGEASGAAAGMLGVQGETEDELMLRLGAASRAMFPGVLRELRDETGVDVEFWPYGTLDLAFGERDETELRRRRDWQAAAGFASDLLSRAELRALEPWASRRASLGVLFRADARVDNAALTLAYAEAARRAGAEVAEGTAVESIAVEGGSIAGVRANRAAFACDAVVNCAGAWAGALAVGLPLPIAPVRGQIAVVRAPRPPFRTALYSPRAYAVARRDGRVLLGSTRESVGYDKQVTAGGLASILRGALEIAPGLADLPATETWSGLRPVTPDRRPIIGRDPTVRGSFAACGHYRNGVLLTPLTARLVADLLAGREDERLVPLRLERFATGEAVAGADSRAAVPR
jgi:glycine oxidase